MSSPAPSDGQHLALVDLVDRLLSGGVVLTGDVVLSVAGVDLVYLGLRLVLTSVDALAERVPRAPQDARAERSW